MDPESACGCYCKTDVQPTPRRSELNSERSRTKFESKNPISKRRTIRSSKKVPFTLAKPVDEDRSDFKRPIVTPPASPMLSPETSVALENVETFIRDVQIQMKQINAVTNCPQKHISPYLDEAPLDDENDQLLYIRERVAHKFQEANGWIDSSVTNLKRQNVLNGETVPPKPKKTIDFSSSKFKTSEDRYKEYTQHEKQEIQRLCSASAVNNIESAENAKNSDEPCAPNRVSERSKKIGTFSVRVCPPVNIKGKLTAQNLENIHISPNPSFVQEATNVGTYMIYHDFCKKDTSPVRKEKFVKIIENNRNVKQNGRSTNVGTSVSKEKSVKELCGILQGNNVKLIENVEKVHKTTTTATTRSINRENLESADLSDIKTTHGDQKSEGGETQSIQNIEKAEEETEIVKKAPGSLTNMIFESGNGQKQVRFKEETSVETRNQNDSVEPRDAKETNGVLEKCLKTLPKFVLLENHDYSENNTEQCKTANLSEELERNFESISLLCKNTNEEYKKTHKEEILGVEERERDERYKMIDQRFMDVWKKHCKNNQKHSKTYYSFGSWNTDSLKNSGDSDDLYNPSMREIDDVLDAYDKIINNVARSTKTIDRFLSRPEFKEYRETNLSLTESNDSVTSISFGRNKIEALKTDAPHYLPTKRESRVHNPVLTHANRERNLHKTQAKAMKSTLARTSSFIKGDNDSRKRNTVSRSLNTFPKRTDANVGGFAVSKKLPEELNVGNLDFSGSTDTDIRSLRCDSRKQNQRENDSSSFNPLSSSSDAKLCSADDSKILKKSLRSSVDNLEGDVTDLKANVTPAQEIDVNVLQKGSLNYTTLYNTVYSNVLKQVLLELKGTTNITEHLINNALHAETRFIEDQIKHAFNVNQIVPMLVKNLLENLKSDVLSFRGRHLEPMITDNLAINNKVCTNVETVGRAVTVHAKSDDESEKQNLQANENFSLSKISRNDVKDFGKDDKSNSFHNDNIPADLTTILKNQLSTRSKDVSLSRDQASSVSKTNNTNSDVKLLNEISNADNNEIYLDKSIENASLRDHTGLQTEENISESLNSKTSPSNVTNESNTNEVNQIDKPEQTSSSQNVNLNENCHIKDILLETINKTSTIGKGEEKVSSISDKNPSVSNDEMSEAEREKSELASVQSEAKHPTQTSSSNSLRSCIPIQSSPRDFSKSSLRNEPLGAITEIKQAQEVNNRFLHDINEMVNEKASCTDTFQKKNILSEFYESLHKELMFSTFDTNNTSMLDQNCRLPDSVITTESNNIETSSDTSRSEGELYQASSSSYSLGEVRMTKKNHSEGENTDDCDNSGTIMITKKMLNSWNEYSKSLAKCVEEI